ncbi:Crp/Fnr family transcriptional regulator [Reichenbachiella carrageenanivorans]|uniref:Crp/Fnr family transcriptional regulator n=1 Tax=Reichenbachiella carrageenanivorans TaxID=2979869 RepID=A0ABY6D1K2_9BACT|nr:Crp/Fnr family transcriptional regulator [Reichenbachiella carrageenanivorans]UXX79609.1 Crp/Fnr family transcriptional regulator [Reichenbachiella carrageenanivorans]
MSNNIKEKLELFAQRFQTDLVDEINQKADLKQFKAGKVLIDFGTYLKSIPLVLSGTIKVIREDQKGNELFLYFLGGGDTCAMSLTCCMSHKKSEIKAVVEEDAEVIMIPMQYMDEWMKYSTWRQFIFGSYNERFEEILNAVDALAFMKLDERLMNYLLDCKQSAGDFSVRKTHQQIAQDLNTSRVVVSRLLKKLEQEGQIELHRNKIEIL